MNTGPPRVYSSEYHDLIDDQSTDAFMTITCSTSDSPPTKVIWMCDGDNITTSDGDFETMQVVTNRRNVYYDNILIVKNATRAAGIHDYTCTVMNSQGSDTHTITTNIPGLMTDCNYASNPYYILLHIMMCYLSNPLQCLKGLRLLHLGQM